MPLPLTVIPIPGPGAEDVLVAPDGRVWTGTADGAIHVHDPADRETTTVTATGGRPLGLENLPDGRILVCDAHRGLLALDPATGDLETLLTEVDGERLLFCNNAAVTADGTIWFSDSSRVWPVEEWKNDLIEHTRTGRLLPPHPRRQRHHRARPAVLRQRRRAHGRGGCRAGRRDRYPHHPAGAPLGRRHPRARRRRGSRTCPGTPTTSPSAATAWSGSRWPHRPTRHSRSCRRARRPCAAWCDALPERLKPKPKQTARVLALDSTGRTVHDLDFDATSWHLATGVREHDGRVWLGSLMQPAIAVGDVPQ